MIFISGVHGAGKSYFCKEVKNQLKLNAYSASKLIVDLKKEEFAKDKLIPDIDENQVCLLTAIDGLNESEEQYLLDGHFCLLVSGKPPAP